MLEHLGKLKVGMDRTGAHNLCMGAVCVCEEGRGVGGVRGQRFRAVWWGQTKGKEKWNRTG